MCGSKTISPQASSDTKHAALANTSPTHRGDTLYSFEVALAPSKSNSATPMLILHPESQGDLGKHRQGISPISDNCMALTRLFRFFLVLINSTSTKYTNLFYQEESTHSG